MPTSGRGVWLWRRLLGGATLAALSALVLRLATGGGTFEVGGTPWLSLRSLGPLMVAGVVLAAAAGALDAPRWRRTLSAHRPIGPALGSAWPLAVVLATGIALRLVQYIAPPIWFLPYLEADESVGRFLATNLFVVGGSVGLAALGRRLEDARTGLLATLVLTLSPLTIYFGRFHLQQAAALTAGVAAALSILHWLEDGGRAAPVLAFGSLAILLDPLNFHLLALALLMWWSRSRCRVREVVLLLGGLLLVAGLLRATFVPTADLWMPPIPPLPALSLSAATLGILADRFLTLLLPAGGAVLFLVGMLRICGRQALVIPAWVVVTLLWTLWAANRHLVQSAVYLSLLVPASLAAARGASWILAASDRTLLARNLGWLTVVGLLFSTWWGQDYALARIYRWNTAVVSDRQSVSLSWVDGFRAHGAWYFVAHARTDADFTDRRFADAMTAAYSSATLFNRVVFPIRRGATDYHRPASAPEPVPLTFEAEELRTRAGRLVPDGLAANGYAVRAQQAGPVVYGPYLVYPRGRYAVEFRIRAAAGGPGGVTGHVDVAARRGAAVLARRELTAADLSGGGGYRDVPLEVSLEQPEELEFRVFSAGTRSLWVDRIRIQVLPDAPGTG